MFCLLLFLLLGRNERVSKAELCHRFDMFGVGEWFHTSGVTTSSRHEFVGFNGTESEGGASENSDGRGLAGPTMFDGGNRCSRDGRHSVTMTTRSCPEHHAEDHGVAARSPVVVDRKVFVHSLKSVPRGSSPGPGGCTFEHLRCLLDETETTELLYDAVCSFARHLSLSRYPPF